MPWGIFGWAKDGGLVGLGSQVGSFRLQSPMGGSVGGSLQEFYLLSSCWG